MNNTARRQITVCRILLMSASVGHKEQGQMEIKMLVPDFEFYEISTHVVDVKVSFLLVMEMRISRKWLLFLTRTPPRLN